MREVARGVNLLRGFPRDMFNVYLMEDVLVDAATRWARGRILSQLRRRRPRLVALTHCHPDHQGIARIASRQFKAPLACHELDVPAMEGRVPMVPDNWIMRLGMQFWAGPPAPVSRVLRDGDEVAGFRVIHPACASRRRFSATTPPRTARPFASWPPSARPSSASATARRFTTRNCWID
jgi:hydroxyacylglutathione hydrolase